MGKTAWWMVASLLGAAAMNACGTSGGTAAATEAAGDQGSGGSTASSSSSSSSSSGAGGASSSSSSGSSSSGSSSSSSGSVTVNGCDQASAEDHTTDTAVNIDFGGSLGLKYAPACIRIKTGTSVTFTGSFSSHPLSGGSSGTADASSPITHTTTGSSATFSFPDAGTFPYFCELHFSSGMEGAIFVE